MNNPLLLVPVFLGLFILIYSKLFTTALLPPRFTFFILILIILNSLLILLIKKPFNQKIKTICFIFISLFLIYNFALQNKNIFNYRTVTFLENNNLDSLLKKTEEFSSYYKTKLYTFYFLDNLRNHDLKIIFLTGINRKKKSKFLTQYHAFLDSLEHLHIPYTSEISPSYLFNVQEKDYNCKLSVFNMEFCINHHFSIDHKNDLVSIYVHPNNYFYIQNR